VIEKFKNAPNYNADGTKGIILHIDDGTGTGGGAWTKGGSIGKHKDKIYWGTEFNNLYYNKGVDNDGKYGFYQERRGIFHYALLAHRNANSHTRNGEAAAFGDKFVLYDRTLQTSSAKRRAVFLHELGHNILGLNDLGSKDHNHLAYQLNLKGHHDDDDCAMVYPLPNDDFPQNYCSTCFRSFKLYKSFVRI
jgi:hypothetical protein